MNKKTVRKCLLVLGALLIVLSAGAFVYMRSAEKRSAAENADALRFIESLTADKTDGVKETLTDHRLPVLAYKGRDYAAVLSLEAHAVSLPVLARWDTRAVNRTPCLFSGSPYNGTLVIGGVDRPGQFDFVSKTDIGETVTVTDMKGAVFRYTVYDVRLSKTADAAALTDENADLALFAYTKEHGKYAIIKCRML